MNYNQKQWRKEKRKQRQILDEVSRDKKSQQVYHQLLACKPYQQARHVGAYLAMSEEVNLHRIIQDAWTADKLVFLPVVVARGKPMIFAPYQADTKLTKDAVGMLVPDVDPLCCFSAEQLDLVITPLVAFDEQRNRIGMGGGFYDRTFAFKKIKAHPYLIGVAFAEQKTNQPIIANAWDIRPDEIVFA